MIHDERQGLAKGWARLGFNYFFSDAVAEYLIEAVDLTARYAHRLFGDYRFDPGSGLWWHRDSPHQTGETLFTLMSTMMSRGMSARSAGNPRGSRVVPPPCLGEDALAQHLDDARAVLASRPDTIPAGPTGLPATFEELREFHLPPECPSTYE